jgi:nucleoside-diphosphate-sugar epimerase
MKILITGSSGFIGQHLTKKLSSSHDIVNFKSDLKDFKNAYNEVIEVNPDIIVHLAARTEVEKSFYEPLEFTEINYLGTENIVNAATKCSNLKNFFFSSTMEVYGWQPVSDKIKNNLIPNDIPAFDENTTPNPNAPYAVAKFACEKYLEYANRCLNLPFTTLRQTNTYGRKDNDFFVVEQIITQMLKNSDSIYLGYKQPYRNFLYIKDLIDLWVILIENYNKVNTGEIFTIGPDNALSIENLADIIAKKLNWNGKIHWNAKPKRAGEIYLLNSSNKKLEETVGWQPTISLDHGLDMTIEYWRKNLECI